MERFVLPKIGRLNVNDIDSPHIEETLRPIWETKADTASRLQTQINLVLDYAKAGKSAMVIIPPPVHWSRRGSARSLRTASTSPPCRSMMYRRSWLSYAATGRQARSLFNSPS